MTTDLTRSGGSTTSEELTTMVVKLTPNKARAALAKVIIELSVEFDLSFPEGPRDLQVENIITFILEHYKTLSANDVKKAVDLNAAQKYHDHVQSYGKLTREFLGACLKRFTGWKSDQRQRGTISGDPKNLEKNLRVELWRDWTRLKGNKKLVVTQYVLEKFDHLVRKGKISEDINQEELQAMEKAHLARLLDPHDKIQVFASATEGANEDRARAWALAEYKATKIKDYLITLKIPKS